jgi:hypothetical protein
MNPFEPAALSPVPTPPRACGLPYDLTWDDLGPHLPGFTTQSASQAQAFGAYEKQGLNGGPNSCILTLRYPVAGDQSRSENVFVKQTRDLAAREAEKYRYLATQGVPVPRLLAAIRKAGGEVILLEFLPTIGIDFRADAEVVELLHLAAQLNAVRDPPAYFNPSPGLPQDEFEALVLNVLTALAGEGALPFPVDAPRWLSAYRGIQAACQEMPLALNHNQFFFQQVGWARRAGGRVLVVFDLETLALAPRFCDIAGLLKPLAAYSGRDPRALFKIYYDKLSALRPLEVGFDQALHELRLVEIMETFESLPWLFESRGSAEAALLGTTPELAMTDLFHSLSALELL